MSKAVAVDGDTQFETSTGKHPADTDQKGSWQPGTLVVTPGETISVNGKKVELSAEMTWDYIGGAASTTPVGPFQDRAELTASPTKLTDVRQHILVEGDEASGTMDPANKIIVTKSQGILNTA